MRWEGLRKSENVEDRRGRMPAGFGRGAGIGGGGLILIVLISLLLGKNPLEILTLLSQSGGIPAGQEEAAPAPPGADRESDFVRAVLGDTEDTWNTLLERGGRDYQEPRLVLFTRAVESACGFASSAVGPFYCPGDRQVYLDLAFFRDLSQRFGAPGDFARAYVIAHEIGHHVQNELGISEEFDRRRGRLGEEEANALSVRLELQADCFAGVWGHYAQQRGFVDFSDVQAALAAATAIGDDRLQMRSQGYVAPESFTHGSSEQRVRWFTRGLEGGDPGRCDAFSAREL
jgi:predicted metalloprotease